MQKKIAVINDLSGYGRCSLTVAIPVSIGHGHQCCPYRQRSSPTTAEFPWYFVFDEYHGTNDSSLDKWKELGLSFAMTWRLDFSAREAADAIRHGHASENCGSRRRRLSVVAILSSGEPWTWP